MNQTVRQRSPSVGGRPPWIEKEMSTRIRIPHTFQLHSYTRPTICTYCKKMLKGLFKQGLKCKDCNYNAHKKCLEKVPKDCTGEMPKEPNEYADSLTGSECNLSHNQTEDDSDEQVDENRHSKSVDCSDLIPVHDGDSSDVSNDKSNPSSCTSSSSQSANIPLMRIVQSVKHTKRRGSKVVKEGWLVHFTNKDRLVLIHIYFFVYLFFLMYVIF